MSYYLYSAELPSAILRSESHQARSTFSSNPLQSRPVLSPSSPTRSRASPPGTFGVALECRLKDTTSHNLQLRHSAYAPCTWGQVRLCVRRLVRPHVYPHVAVHPGDQGVSANPEVRVDLYQPLCPRSTSCTSARSLRGGGPRPSPPSSSRCTTLSTGARGSRRLERAKTKDHVGGQGC
jgi:hypothetical protein